MAVWGFVIVAACSFLVALSLAELASCYPLAGGPYFWRVPHISWAVTAGLSKSCCSCSACCTSRICVFRAEALWTLIPDYSFEPTDGLAAPLA